MKELSWYITWLFWKVFCRCEYGEWIDKKSYLVRDLPVHLWKPYPYGWITKQTHLTEKHRRILEEQDKQIHIETRDKLKRKGWSQKEIDALPKI